MIPIAASILGLTILLWIVVHIIERRTDRDPHCRRCRYNLVGLEPLPDSCPECGRSTSRRRAIRVGRRKRSRRMRAITVVSVLLLCGVLGAKKWLSANDINEYKPVWWLVLDMQSSSVGRGHTAFNELNARLLPSDLGDQGLRQFTHAILKWAAEENRPWDDQWEPILAAGMRHPDFGAAVDERLDEIVAAVLARQADENTAWVTDWGNRVEFAIDQQRTDVSDIETYLRTGFESGVYFDAPVRVHVNRPWSMHWGAQSMRFGYRLRSVTVDSPYRDRIGCSTRIQSVSIDGVPQQVNDMRGWRELNGSDMHLVSDMPSLSETGTYAIEVVIEYGLDDIDLAGNVLPTQNRWTRTYRRTMDVVSRDVLIVRLINDDLFNEHLQSATEINVIWHNGIRQHQTLVDAVDTPASSDGNETRTNWREIEVEIPAANLPMSIALYAMQEEREELIGMMCESQQDSRIVNVTAAWPAGSWIEQCDSVDLELRTYPKAADAKRMSEIVNATARFEDVWLDRVPRPSTDVEARLDELQSVLEIRSVDLRSNRRHDQMGLLNFLIEAPADMCELQLDLIIVVDGTEVICNSVDMGFKGQRRRGDDDGRKAAALQVASPWDPSQLPERITTIIRTPPHYPFTFEKRFEDIPLTKKNK